jgi:hypothetical protein
MTAEDAITELVEIVNHDEAFVEMWRRSAHPKQQPVADSFACRAEAVKMAIDALRRPASEGA